MRTKCLETWEKLWNDDPRPERLGNSFEVMKQVLRVWQII
jgi:hypothetical protein